MNGQPIGQLEPTWAWDANGQPVETETSIDGDEVVLSIPHRGEDVAYPIQADPSMTSSFYFTYSGDSAWAYWGWYDTTAGGYVDPVTTNGWWRPRGGDGYAGRALYMTVPWPGKNFNAGGGWDTYQAFWYFRAPGIAKITHVRMNSGSNDVPGSLTLCAFWGIASAGVNYFEGDASHGEGCTAHWNFAWDFYSTGPSAGNVWLMGQYAYSRGTLFGGAIFKDSVIDMHEQDKPAISGWAGDVVSRGGESWIERPDAVIGITAKDQSLGIRSMTLSALGRSSTVNFHCPYGPCPRQLPANGIPDPVTGQQQPPPQVSVSTLAGGQPVPDGRQQVTATVTDAVNQTGTRSAVFIFDHNAPTIELSGALWDQRAAVLDADAESFNLHVRAADAGSGAKTIRVFVDGQLQYATTPSAGACPRPDGTCEIDWQYNASKFSWDVHTIRVEADDANLQSPVAVKEFVVNDTGTPVDEFGQIGDGTCAGGPCAIDTSAPPFMTGFAPLARVGIAQRSAAPTDIPFQWGIADNNYPPGFNSPHEPPYDIFGDPRYYEMANMPVVRRTVPWNVALLSKTDPEQARIRNGIEEWINRANARGKTVVIGFDKCSVAGDHTTPCRAEPIDSSSLPNTANWQKAMNAFLNTAPFSSVHTLVSWNEPNASNQPTFYDATRAGQLYRELYDLCALRGDCHVTAGEFLDLPLKQGFFDWMRAYRAGMGRAPESYGWHAYNDGKKRVKPNTPATHYWMKLRRFLLATAQDTGPDGYPPMIFLTEQGAVYSHITTPPENAPLLTQDQAELLTWAYINEAATRDPRIRMFAYYQMQGTPPRDGHLEWDSGFRAPTPTGEPFRSRPYNMYRNGRPSL